MKHELQASWSDLRRHGLGRTSNWAEIREGFRTSKRSFTQENHTLKMSSAAFHPKWPD